MKSVSSMHACTAPGWGGGGGGGFSRDEVQLELVGEMPTPYG